MIEKCETKTCGVDCPRPAEFVVEGKIVTEHATCREHAEEWKMCSTREDVVQVVRIEQGELR
jgi:hypothetical protein